MRCAGNHRRPIRCTTSGIGSKLFIRAPPKAWLLPRSKVAVWGEQSWPLRYAKPWHLLFTGFGTTINNRPEIP